MKKLYKDAIFYLSSSRYFVAYGEEFTVTLRATGDVKKGDKIQYRVYYKDGRNNVRAFDFTHSNEYGVFELDQNLECSISFKNNIYRFSEIDRIFCLSIYYNDGPSVEVIFNKNYIPLEDYPEKSKTEDSYFEIEALQESITEGEDAQFLIKYYNVLNNKEIYYEYIDTKDSFSEISKFRTNSTGMFKASIPTLVLKNTSLPFRFIRLWLKNNPSYYKTIKVLQIPPKPISGRYPPGTYELDVAPGLEIRIYLIGAGGAGGAAINSRQPNWDVDASGGNGGNTTISISNSTLTASGGSGATYGRAHNGSAYNDGEAGLARDNVVSDFIGTVVKNIKGNDGAPWSKEDVHLGGAAVTTLGDIGFNGSGGDGAKGTRYSKGEGYWYGFGGAGGGGGFIEATFKNNLNNTLRMTLTVGAKGKAYDLESTQTTGNLGYEGEDGFAIIESI